MRTTTFFALALTIGSLAGSTVIAQTPPDLPPRATSDVLTSSDAPLGPHDVIEIKVFQDPSLNTKVAIGDDGKINMPLLGKVDVSGLSPNQVEIRIKGLLEARYITKADVSVQVAEYGN